jgi:hypothetical protein
LGADGEGKLMAQITITEYRNAVKFDDTYMEVEIRHPTEGWLEYGLTANDPDNTISNDDLLALIGSNYKYATGDKLESWRLIKVISRAETLYNDLGMLKGGVTEEQWQEIEAYMVVIVDAVHAENLNSNLVIPPVGAPAFLSSVGFNISNY